uniref:NADH dehydrogenase subunit 2 n=1 Tax=Carinata dushanensis TaxID=3040693 RepID=UPI002551EB30|nr:NADH dehydrogenase subunit 2 [Carinata dushanensis]WGC89404.1 NADH dehydrogenase subunit 2 [Carinata dushanensis]
MNSSSILFFMSMILGIMVSLCSNNLISIWIGLEISLLCFIPIMAGGGLLSSESSIKYFIIQSLSSLLLMLGLMIMVMEFGNLGTLIICTSLLIKLGIAPFHLWVLSVVEGLTNFCLFIMLFLMKLSPLFIISMMNYEFMFISFITMMVGSISGLIQNSIRKLLAFSSIYNLGMVIACISNNSLWLIYFLIYGFILFCLIIMVNSLSSNYVNQVIMMEFNSSKKLIFWLSMLSMGGLPPFLGFINKLMIIEFFMINENLILMVTLIFTALLVIFYYMRLSFVSLMFFSLNPKWSLNLSFNLSFIVLMMNLISFPLFLSLKSLI